jgi:hypothetical protein
MFSMTALAALAASAAKYGVAGLLAVPVLLAAAVGTLAGRVGHWLKLGVGIDLAFLGLALLELMMRV